MQQTELPLYPKRSSIYNKISQIVIAITIIIVVLSLWSIRNQKNLAQIDQHFSQISKQHMFQIKLSLAHVIENNLSIQDYIDQVSQQSWLKSLHWYGPTGVLLAQSEQAVPISELYGLKQDTADRSEEYIPFVTEVYSDKLEGYLRVTIEKSQLTQSLLQMNEDNLSLFRLIILLAGIAGFLITRGFNRFSRQGFRLGKS